MSHYKILSLLLFYLFLTSFQEDAPFYARTLFDQQIIYGRVSAVIEIELTPKTDGTKTDSAIWRTKFDHEGNTVRESYTSIHHLAPNVDAFDKFTGEKIKRRRLKNISVFNYYTKHSGDGKKSTISINYGNKEIYFFDENGLLIHKETYQKDGTELYDKSLYKYDDEKRLVEINTYTAKDSLYEEDTYKYNDKGLVNERDIFYDENHVQKHLLQSQYLFEYVGFDRFGNWTKMRQKETESGNRENKIVTNKIIVRKITYY